MSVALIYLSLSQFSSAEEKTRMPDWPTVWKGMPGFDKSLYGAVPEPEGTRRKATVPDTLDLAERINLSVNALTGNYDPNAQVFDFGMNPPKVVDIGYVLPKHLRTLPMLRGVSGSLQGLDTEGLIMQSQLEALRNTSAEANSHFFSPGYGPLILALAKWDERQKNPLAKSWISYLAAMMRENSIVIKPGNGGEERAFYPPSSLRDKEGKWFDADKRFISPMPYHPPEEPVADQQGVEGTVKWEQALVLRALLRDFQVNGERKSLKMADKYANFILKSTMWEEGGPTNGAFAGHWHGNLWTLQALLEYSLVKKDAKIQQIVLEAYQHARDHGVLEIGWVPSWLNPEKFKRSPVLGQLNETCGVADTLILAVMLSEAGLGDYWDDVDGMVRNYVTQMQFCDLDEMRSRSGGNPGNDALLQKYVGGFGMAEPTAIKPQVLGCCSTNGALSLVEAWRGIVTNAGGVTTVNLLLNRASPWLDVNSYLPNEGKVELRILKQTNVRVRLPAWLPASTVTSNVGGRAVKPVSEGKYLVFSNLRAGDDVTLTFQVPEKSEKRTFAGQEYTLGFRGGNLVDIQPRNSDPALLPLFTTNTAITPVPMKEVERFIPKEEVSFFKVRH